MTTLAANLKRTYELGRSPVANDLPMVATDTIFEGAAVGDNGSGLSRPLATVDPFQGFALKKAVNAGAASAEVVRVRSQGVVKLTVATVADADDQGLPVYALDDNSFTLVASGASPIGRVQRWISGTTCMVAFTAISLRDPA